MTEGTIKRLTDRGFGFIDTGTNQDMFFHMSNVEGTTFDELREGQQVSYVFEGINDLKRQIILLFGETVASIYQISPSGTRSM